MEQAIHDDKQVAWLESNQGLAYWTVWSPDINQRLISLTEVKHTKICRIRVRICQSKPRFIIVIRLRKVRSSLSIDLLEKLSPG